MSQQPKKYIKLRQHVSRWLKVGAAISVLLGVLIAGASNRLNARRHYVSFQPDFHACLDGRGLSFYSDAQYRPYRGSIVGLAGNAEPIVSASNFPFYYRHFRWSDGRVLWTLSIMLPLVLLPFTILPAVWLWQVIRLPQRHHAFAP